MPTAVEHNIESTEKEFCSKIHKSPWFDNSLFVHIPECVKHMCTPLFSCNLDEESVLGEDIDLIEFCDESTSCNILPLVLDEQNDKIYDCFKINLSNCCAKNKSETKLKSIQDSVCMLLCSHFKHDGATSAINECVSNSTVLSITGHNNLNELHTLCWNVTWVQCMSAL